MSSETPKPGLGRRRTLVKICGISEVKHARAAAVLGADFVGMVFAPSRRQVTMGNARQIAKRLRIGKACLPPSASAHQIEEALRGGHRPLLVGVFADQAVDEINSIAEECRLDVVQLSGSESWEICALVKRPVFKCMKVHTGQRALEVLAQAGDDAVLLLDPYVSGTYGGTGQTLDWRMAGEVAGRRPTVLAGGLNPQNITEAIRTVHPWAVDVSSGVETDGAKDVEKVRAFIQAVKQT